VDETIEIVDIPPACHVALAEAERTLSEHSGAAAVIEDADVAGPGSVDADAALVKQRPEGTAGSA
jgi:hypothetical protein